MAKYYDGTKLLSKLDIRGKRPEIFMSTSNRTAGKTTYYSRLLVNAFLRKNKKFFLLYRFNCELDSISDKFYKDIGSLFFTGHFMSSKARANGVYHDLYLDENHCGYALSLNNADQIKIMSHLFSDADHGMFDEFQSETNHYCPREIEKLLSVHTSIARGKSKQVRYVPLYMLSNTVSLINPYFVEMDITNRLRADTRYLRGDGFVLEQAYYQGAAKEQEESGFNRAFKRNRYVAYASQNVYLNDNYSFIEKPSGKSRYLVTLRYNGKDFAIREYGAEGYLYCDDKADSSFPNRISVTTDDHRLNYVMLRRNDFIISNFRYLFEHGAFRFKDLLCKECVLKALSY